MHQLSQTPMLSILAGSQGSACPKCSREFAKLQASGLCAACDSSERIARQKARADAERDKAAAELMGRLDSYIEEQLGFCGIEKRERRGRLDKVPRGVKLAQPQEGVKALLRGEIPESGWGILGTTGTGKTLNLSAILREHVRAVLSARVPSEGPIPVDWIRWESVPDLVDWLRDHARSDAALVASRIHAACTCPILVLDDLTAERRISDYGSDYAIGKLGLIVDARHRKCLPTWYTANVKDEAGLVSAYGARLVSRLVGENPAAVVDGEDLRLV